MAKKKTDKNENTKVDLRRLKKDERPAPSTGQSGPEMNLPAEKLNKDERLVLAQLDTVDRAPAKIVEITDAIKKTVRNFTTLRTRNALRRPVRGGLVTQKDRGEYKITAKGTKTSIAATDLPLPAKGTKVKATKAKAAKPAKVAKAPKVAKQAAAPAEPKKAKKARVKGKRLTASPEVDDDADTAPTPTETTIAFNDEVETELTTLGATFKRGDAHYKGAILVAAIRTAGISDTKIAKATGLSRGFCMPRVKRLKEAGVLSAPGTNDEFKNLVAIAEGDKRNGVGPDDEPEGEPEPEELD